MLRHLSTPLLLSILFGTPAKAADPGNGSAVDRVEIPTAPDLPAASILSLDSTKFLHPKGVSEITTHILSGINLATGALESGLAFEIAPIWLVIGGDSTLDNWQQDYGTELASRFHFSMAMTSQSESTDGTETVDEYSVLATALHFGWLNTGDPRGNTKYTSCVADQLLKTPPSPGESEDEQARKRRQRKQDVEANCFNNKTGSELSSSIGLTLRSPSQNVDGLEVDRFQFWTSYAYGEKRTGQAEFGIQFLAGLHYLHDFPGESDSLRVGIGLALGVSYIDLELRVAAIVADFSDDPEVSPSFGGTIKLSHPSGIFVGLDVGGGTADSADQEVKGFITLGFGEARQDVRF